MQAPKSFGKKQVQSNLENAAISRLSWRFLPLKEIFLVWECFGLYSSNNSQQKTAYYSKQIFFITYWGKYTFFSATGDYSINCKKLIYQVSEQAYVQFLNN